MKETLLMQGQEFVTLWWYSSWEGGVWGGSPTLKCGKSKILLCIFNVICIYNEAKHSLMHESVWPNTKEETGASLHTSKEFRVEVITKGTNCVIMCSK